MFLKRLGIVLAALIPVAIVGAFVFRSNDEETVTTAPSTNTATTTSPSSESPTTTTTPSTATTTDSAPTTTSTPLPTPDSAVSSSMYEDGTYTAEGPYTSPAGSENITVTLTIANDVVTAASVVPHGVEKSALYQAKFVSGYRAMVVGTNLAELNLSHVSGSSLTPIGFNAAVESIKAQAEV